jgi:hypothetical protein
MPMPKRMRSTRSSRGVSEASTPRRRLAQVRLDRRVDRQDRVLVLDEVAEVAVLLVGAAADRLTQTGGDEVSILACRLGLAA